MKANLSSWVSKGGALTAKAFGFVLVLSALAVPASAVPSAPEIDPGLATSALALLSGGLALIAARTRRK